MKKLWYELRHTLVSYLFLLVIKIVPPDDEGYVIIQVVGLLSETLKDMISPRYRR